MWCGECLHKGKIDAANYGVLSRFTLFRREICFVMIHILWCGEKLNRKLHMWRKNYKYEVCDYFMLGWPKQFISLFVGSSKYGRLLIPKSQIIHSKSWSSWSTNSADNFEFPAEKLSENAKTISLSTQEQKILKLVKNKSQEVLKSFAKKPQIYDLHVPGFRSFEI